MAKFRDQDLKLKDNQEIIFGDGDDSNIKWDGVNLILSTTLLLSTPVSAYHASTKEYVDNVIKGLDWQESVLTKSLATPSAGAAEGARYIVAPSGTGAWTGKDDQITERISNVWVYTVPDEGMACLVEDEDLIYLWTGTVWTNIGSTVDHGALSGLGDKVDHTWAITTDATRPMTSDWDIGNAIKLITDQVEARDGAGLKLTETTGDTGIYVEDTTGNIALHAFTPDSDARFYVNMGDENKVVRIIAEDIANDPRLDIQLGPAEARLIAEDDGDYQTLALQPSGGTVNVGVATGSALFNVGGTFQLNLGTSVTSMSTDVSLSGDSNDTLVTEAAIKSYVDTAGVGTLDHGLLFGLGDKADHTWAVTIDGTRVLTGDWDIGNTRRIIADGIQARDGDGILLEDSGSTLGLFVSAGGYTGAGLNTPLAQLHVYHSSDDIPFIVESGDANSFIELRDVGSTDGYVRIGAVSDDLVLYAANTSSLRISTNGLIDVANSSIVLDEDAMGTNSATQLATQQSIKSYADNYLASRTVDTTQPVHRQAIVYNADAGQWEPDRYIPDITIESDMFYDLLGNSIYTNCTFDGFRFGTDLVDTGATTASFNASGGKYDFTVGEVITSEDLFDSGTGLASVAEGMVVCDYTGSISASATADGTNWEVVTLNEVFTFSNPGTTLKLRVVGNNTGVLNSWGILYNPDPGSLAIGGRTRNYTEFYYAGVAVDEDVITDGFYFDNSIMIDAVTIHAQTGPVGANLTLDILKDGAEQTKIATLTDGATYEKTTLATAYPTFSSTERFGMVVKSVGSTTAGMGFNITIHYVDR